ncbi:MAG: TIGR03016 family PEP-CTERM system-associated outer membrane protein [Betaproteobacteria bacterium]
MSIGTLFPPCVESAEWQPTLSIGTSATLSDNALLRPHGQEEADLIISASPTIAVNKNGARLKVKGSYTPWFYTYLAGTGETTVRNTMDGVASLEAVENLVYVDGRANIYQSFISPFGGQPNDPGTVSSNRTEVATLGLSPYIRGELAGGSRYELRDDINYTTFRTGERPDLLSNAVIGRWSGKGGTVIVPGIEYNYTSTQFGSQPAFVTQLVRARAGLNLSTDFQVFATGGYESNDFVFSKQQGTIYGGGFDWKPSPRTSVRASVERRFFGNSYDFDALYRTRLTAWKLRGGRSVQTSQQQFQQAGSGSTGIRDALDSLLSTSIPDPVARAQFINQLLIQSGLGSFLNGPTPVYSPRVLLVENIEPSLAIQGTRTTLTFSVFWRKTKPLSDAVATNAVDALAGLNDITQRGGSISLIHKLNSKQSADASIYRIGTKGANGAVAGAAPFESTQSMFRVGLSQQISTQTSASVGLRWQTFNSNSVTNFQERAVLVTLTHSFF